MLSWLILVAAVGAGLTAGVFLAFSSFVMAGLGRAPAPVGVRAMQEINRAAPSPVFMLTLFGTALLGVGLAVAAIVGRGPGWGLVVAGAAAYLVCVGLTIGYHVPRNKALAALDPPPPARREGVADLPERLDPAEPPADGVRHGRLCAAAAQPLAELTGPAEKSPRPGDLTACRRHLSSFGVTSTQSRPPPSPQRRRPSPGRRC